MCQDNVSCDFNTHKRVIRDWNFSGGTEPQELGSPGADTYRYFSGSSNGEVVFGYSGKESYCPSCNSGGGENKVRVARFVLWDRASRRTIAESRTLDVERHSCFLAIGLGSCTSYERAPELQMSDDGKAVLAFKPLTDHSPDQKPRPLLVFRRP
jgi:hypothetical protein